MAANQNTGASYAHQYQNAFDNYDNDVIKVIDHSLGTDNQHQLLSRQQANFVDQAINMHTMTTPGDNTNEALNTNNSQSVSYIQQNAASLGNDNFSN